MQTNSSSFRSTRKFALVSYEMGHGPLLFRSGKTEVDQTRIDVLVLDVRALEVRAWSEGLEINEVDHDYLRGFASNPIAMMEAGLRAYAVSGKAWRGFIVGGALCVQEDDADFLAPSSRMAGPSRKPALK